MQKSKKPLKTRSSVVAIVAAVVIAILLGGSFAVYKAAHHKKSQPVTASQSTKGETSANRYSSSGTSTKGTTPQQQSTNPDNSQTNSIAPTKPLAPIGDFVSNHHPNLSGSPAPSNLTSVCTTTPGAKCSITFKKGDTTKSLPMQITDEGGSSYWTWKLQDIGLTVGSWQVTATATLNGQAQSTTDAMNLEVAQ